MFEERFPQILSMSNPAGGFAGLGADGSQVLADKLGHVGSRQVAPEVFHWVEFRRVRRQILCGQPTCLLCNPLLNISAAVSRQPIPQQHRFSSANVSLKRCQVRQDLRLLDGSRPKTQTQPDAPGCGIGYQAGDGRQPLPIERRHQNRCLSARRPGPTHAGAFGKPTFVQENQQRTAVASLFLILGQRYRNQRLMASSLRSRALRSGRWQLQPNCPRTFQT